MPILLHDIHQLLQVRPEHSGLLTADDMKELPILENAWLLLDGNQISGYGTMDSCPSGDFERIDATGRIVLPAWCDSHTHLVYAGNRIGEFTDRINGLSYEEIAARGGGILNSAALLNATSEDALFEQSCLRLEEVMRQGTGAIEIKSGYGLTVEGELKMLRVIRRLKEKYPVAIKATFLGAHAFPAEFKTNHPAYIDRIIREMLPKIASENLADYIDAFCETGYFSVDETLRIMEAGKAYGLPAKIHVNQFTAIGGIAAAVSQGALSVDHLEVLEAADLEALKGSGTVPVALPLCSLFINIPYTPAREILDAGIPLAIATDYNPGTAPSGNMNLAVALGCFRMKLTPAEAINAATINGAYAMGLSTTHGSISVGKKANLILTRPMARYEEIGYSFGSDLVEGVFVEGLRIR